jgi:hypothetical protein
MNNCEFKEIIVFKDFEIESGILRLERDVYLSIVKNNCEFKEIVVFKDFEIENGVLGLDRDCYLSIVKFLDSLILRKV